ncbi:CLIP domain-containing serine protease B9 [Drosophila grimshawi]|uniref:GH14240 n=1 Tax=Drosophila grimshawi TaxID=7222 RepID=B4JY73_DROGR|nr:CLIP domain-containing serine protease B9 [Drosophila grimshawi]EDV90635.1 GH14240 [Drosophila grimshawi]
MNTKGKLVLLLLSTMLSVNTNASATTKCGSFQEYLLYSTDTEAKPTEYTWMGVLYELEDSSLTNTNCSVIIVSESHVLATGSCVREKRPESLTVRLGMWDERHKPGNEVVCDLDGYCVSRPVDYQVKGILVHPQADAKTGDYDLAILELKERINWTQYIQPLCVNPNSEPESLISRIYHYSGFDNSDYIKGKGLTETLSNAYCKVIGKLSALPSAHQFCTYPDKQTHFYNGAALMGINVEKDVPRNFYLIGILLKFYENDERSLLFFHDIRPVRDWIISNTRTD